MRLIGTRMYEQDVGTGFAGDVRRNVAGQTGSSTEFLPNFAPTPEWAGNMFWTYARPAVSFSSIAATARPSATSGIHRRATSGRAACTIG
jgi:hypothetical protein